MIEDLSSRKTLGRWLALACSQDPMRPNLHGVAHWTDGWVYATDGHRLHAIEGASDGSGLARCPHTSGRLPDEPPDFEVLANLSPVEPLEVTIRGIGLLASVEGVLKAAKRAGVEKTAPAVLTFEPDLDRLSVAMSREGFSAAIVVRDCIYQGGGGLSLALNPRYLVEALAGMCDVDSEAQIAITAESPVSPVLVRLIPNLVTVGMKAILMPMRADEDGGRGVQEVLAGLPAARKREPPQGKLGL